MAKKKTKKVVAKPKAKPKAKKEETFTIGKDLNLRFTSITHAIQELERRIVATNVRLDRIVDAIAHSKKVKGL